MRGLAMIGAAMLVAGCANSSGLVGAWSSPPPFATLQQMCGGQAPDYGADTQAVYSAVYDAYVANRHGKLPQERFCSFQTGLAQQYTAHGASGDMQSRNQWVAYLNDQRAQALNWRASADPTLRGG